MDMDLAPLLTRPQVELTRRGLVSKHYYRVSVLGANQEPPRKGKEKAVKRLCFLLLHKPLIPRGIDVKTPEGVSKCWGTQRSRTMQLQQLGESVSRWGRAL